MHIYALTELGKKIARTKTGSTPEMKVLQYLYENRTATDSELDTVTEGGSLACRSMKRRNLVRELTT